VHKCQAIVALSQWFWTDFVGRASFQSKDANLFRAAGIAVPEHKGAASDKNGDREPSEEAVKVLLATLGLRHHCYCVAFSNPALPLTLDPFLCLRHMLQPPGNLNEMGLVELDGFSFGVANMLPQSRGSAEVSMEEDGVEDEDGPAAALALSHQTQAATEARGEEATGGSAAGPDGAISTPQLPAAPPKLYQTVLQDLQRQLAQAAQGAVGAPAWDAFPHYLGEGTAARLLSLARLHLGPGAERCPVSVRELAANSNKVLLGGPPNSELYQGRVVR
jgi:hypothetical protein